MTFSYKFRVAKNFNWVISGKLPGSSRWWFGGMPMMALVRTTTLTTTTTS